MFFLCIIIVVILVYKYGMNDHTSYDNSYNTKPHEETINNTYEQKKNNDYSNNYQKKYLLTKNEYYEYKKLQASAKKNNLIVCPKVRLLDLVEPRRGPNYMSYLGKIQSKHVDFVVCDSNLFVKGVIELDDNSHNRPDRIERDAFVDEVLLSVGYIVIRTRSITESSLDAFVPKQEKNAE